MSPLNNQFRIELPDGWKDQTAYTFMGPEIRGVQHMVTLSIDTALEHDDLAEFARSRIDMLAGTMQGMEILKEEQRTLENGTPVYEMACRWIPVDGAVMFQKYYYVIHDGAGYTFAGTFTKQTLKTIGVEIERMMNTFSPGVTGGPNE
ncbi:MAG: DcrB-related protein [Candidatus Zixiibacteriota bacterium]|nr:MAG: DcrB-related protein [candidate division Zixibacteria bacterium]